MYNITPYEPKIRLYNNVGDVWEFKNIDEAALEIRRMFRFHDLHHILYKDVTDYYKTRSWLWERERYRTQRWLYGDDYIVVVYWIRSEFGDVITADDLLAKLPKHIPSWINRMYPTFKFRNGPVPYRGGRRRYRIRRHPKTLQELKHVHHLENDLKNDPDLSEHNIQIRKKRSKTFLPTLWDDIYRSDHEDRNWKRSRKTQWKP